MKKVLRIKSVSNVITNSSTEVFLVKNDEALNEFVKTLKYIMPWTTFNTEEDIKEHCREIYDKEECYCAEWMPSDIVVNNPLESYDFITTHKSAGVEFDEMWEKIKKWYLPLIGYTVFEEENNSGSIEFFDELDKLAIFTKEHHGTVNYV